MSPSEAVAYQRRVVAFVDVLGWSELTNSSPSDPRSAEALQVACRELASKQHDEVWRPIVSGGGSRLLIEQISDSLVISTEISHSAIREVIDIIQALSWNLLFGAGCLLRGHVAIGDLLHTRERAASGLPDIRMCFGPALVAAVNQEKRNPPCVTVDEEVCRLLIGSRPLALTDPLCRIGQCTFIHMLNRVSLLPAFVLFSGTGDASRQTKLLRIIDSAEASCSPEGQAKWAWVRRYAELWLATLRSHAPEAFDAGVDINGACEALRISLPPSGTDSSATA